MIARILITMNYNQLLRVSKIYIGDDLGDNWLNHQIVNGQLRQLLNYKNKEDFELTKENLEDFLGFVKDRFIPMAGKDFWEEFRKNLEEKVKS